MARGVWETAAPTNSSWGGSSFEPGFRGRVLSYATTECRGILAVLDSASDQGYQEGDVPSLPCILLRTPNSVSVPVHRPRLGHSNGSLFNSSMHFTLDEVLAYFSQLDAFNSLGAWAEA
jgi:hypothetical protein